VVFQDFTSEKIPGQRKGVFIKEKLIMTERVKNAITLFVIAAVFLIISRVVFRFVFPFFFLFFLLGLICIVLGISILKKGRDKRN